MAESGATKEHDISESRHPGLAAGVAFLGLLFAVMAAAQPRSVEVFGQAGYGNVYGDEGSNGSGPVYSGALTLPFASRWAVDLDVMYNTTKRDSGPFEFGSRRTTFSPGLQYRRGGERTYGFVAFGAGVATEQTYFEENSQRLTANDTGMTLHTRGGFVTTLKERLLLRAEVYMSFRFVAPDIGVKAGIGYRF